MPSITGIWISVSSRSNAPCSRVRISSASAPSSAVTVAWPSMATARATSRRMESSSSAINTRGIAALSLFEHDLFGKPVPTFPDHALAWSKQPGSGLAAGQVMLAEEPYVDIAPFRGRRGEARLEPGAFTRLQCGLLQHRLPGVDLGALRVTDAETQPRQFDRLAALAHDHALDHQHRLAVNGLVGDLQILETQSAQIHIKPDHLVEGGGLRQQPHHVVAPDDQCQHQCAHRRACRRQADHRFTGNGRKCRQPEQPGKPRARFGYSASWSYASSRAADAQSAAGAASSAGQPAEMEG